MYEIKLFWSLNSSVFSHEFFSDLILLALNFPPSPCPPSRPSWPCYRNALPLTGKSVLTTCTINVNILNVSSSSDQRRVQGSGCWYGQLRGSEVLFFGGGGRRWGRTIQSWTQKIVCRIFLMIVKGLKRKMNEIVAMKSFLRLIKLKLLEFNIQ